MAKENAKKFFSGAVTILFLLSIGAGITSSTVLDQQKMNQGNNPSEPLPTYTHTVLAEEATATWCVWCPYVMNVLHNEEQSGLYDFKYVSLVQDMNTYANARCNELGVTGYPTVVYDGGYTRIVGWTGSDTEYNNALNTCGARAVWNLDETLSVHWIGSALLNITVDVNNHQTSAYAGHIHAYVTEINSRWWNRGVQYHYAMIGNYALNQNINVPASGNIHLAANWNGNSYGMGDIQPDNIMVIVSIFRSGTNYVDDTIGVRTQDTNPPLWRNQGENASGILRGSSILLSAQGEDGFGLNRAILQTNESGSWQNITGKYGSPMNLNGAGGQWVWTNFTWQNQAIPQGRRIGWRIFYNDTSGNWNRTNIMSFDILNNPVLTDYTSKIGYTGDSFTFNASMVDDQGIAAAYVEYWYGSGQHTNLTMTHTNGNFYARTITVQLNSLDSLHYVISAKDPLNYWSSTGEKIVTIFDNDNPVWRNQGESKTSLPQGDSVVLSTQGKDNVALQWAWLATNESGQWLTYGGKPWWNLGWGYCKTIVINHSKVNADLANFPVLVSLVSPDFVAHAQHNGNDFVFSDSTNTTKLNHEIEYYNSTTGELDAWVNVPLISSTQDTILNLYYGNATCGNQQNVINTWNAGYIMVHHMTGATYTNLKDSTGNHWDMTSQGGNPTYNQPGQIAKSVDFDPAGTWDYLKASGFRLPNNSTYTGSAWVYVDGSSGNRRYIFDGDSNEGISLLVWTDGRFKAVATTDIGGAYCYSTTQASGSPQWLYVCTRADTTAERLDLFVNGVSENHSTISGAIVPETEGLNIATNMNNNTYYMNGRMDEIRISNVARSDSWIHTEYTMMLSPSTFARVGAETIRDGGSKYGSPMNLNGVTEQWAWSNFTWQNPLIPEGRTVGWRIYYVDSSKNQGSTDMMSFIIGTGLPTVQIDGNCYYQGMIPVNTVSVDIINTVTGQHWQASTNNNHYTLNLHIGSEINAGDQLRFIARDGNESVNVTDHTVTTSEISNRAIHLDMILSIHYRDLKSFPYYQPQVDTGAAVMKMMMDYLMWNSTTDPNGPPSVYSEQTLYTSYKGPDNTINGSELCGGLNTEIDDLHHNWQYGYFFAPYADTTANNVLKQICIWLDYPVNYYNNIRDVDVPKPGHPNHVPIAVPLYGNYNNWAVIRGIHTDRNAWLPPTQLTIYGFWVNGYLPGGIGENTYVTAQRFQSAYFTPLSVPGDAFNGKYLAITDPYRNFDQTQLKNTKVSIGQSTTSLSSNDKILIRSLRDGSTPTVLKEKATNLLVKAAFDQTMNVLKYDDTALAAQYAETHVVGKPLRAQDHWTITFSGKDITVTVLVDFSATLLEFSIR